jgi:hemerythrin superfamily protein
MNTTRAPVPDVIDALATDHREVEGLLRQIRSESDPGRRREATDQLIAELVRHSVAEERYVYPAMRTHVANGDEAVEHDTREHRELEQLMKHLEDLDAEDVRFRSVIGELQRVLTDHVQDEEREQFPLLRANVPAGKLAELAVKVEHAKKLAPTRPHPATPNSELFHKLVGPGVGLVDRLRDKLTQRPS